MSSSIFMCLNFSNWLPSGWVDVAVPTEVGNLTLWRQFRRWSVPMYL